MNPGLAGVEHHHAGELARRRRRKQPDPQRGRIVGVVRLPQEVTDVDAVGEVVVAGGDAADVYRLPLLLGDVDVAPTDGDALEEAQRTRLVAGAVAALDPLLGRGAERRQRRLMV